MSASGVSVDPEKVDGVMSWAKQKGGRKSPKVRILELGCKRTGEISLNFRMNVRGSKCKPKS